MNSLNSSIWFEVGTGACGVIGLKGETAEAPGDRDGERGTKPGLGGQFASQSGLISAAATYASSSHIARRSGQAQAEGAGQDREPDQLLQAFL